MNFQLFLFFIILIIILSSSIFIIYTRRNSNNDINQPLNNNDIKQPLNNNDIVASDTTTTKSLSPEEIIKHNEEIRLLKKTILDLTLKINHFDKELTKCDKRTMHLNEEITSLKNTIVELNLKNNHFDKELSKSKQLTDKCEINLKTLTTNINQKSKKNDTSILTLDKDKDKHPDKKNHLHSVKTVERDAYMMGLDASIMPLHHKKATKKDNIPSKTIKNSTKTIKTIDKSSTVVVNPTSKSIPPTPIEKHTKTPTISDSDLSKIINAVSSSTTIAPSLVETPITPPAVVDSKDKDTIKTNKKQSNKIIKEPMSVNFKSPNISKSLPASFDPSSGYEGPFFYMYELDKEFWWRWPDAGTDCSTNGYVGHEHAELSGMGTPIQPDNGLFLTWHFSLFSSLYNRYLTI
jgi:hypothetical protein